MCDSYHARSLYASISCAHACVCMRVRPHAIFSSRSPFQVISLGSKLSLKVSLLFQSLSAPGCAWSTRVANTCWKPAPGIPPVLFFSPEMWIHFVRSKLDRTDQWVHLHGLGCVCIYRYNKSVFSNLENYERQRNTVACMCFILDTRCWLPCAYLRNKYALKL